MSRFVSTLKSFGRRWWHQLTSMRTALILLLALALSAIPGSVFPQRAIAPEDVNAYYAENPDLAPWLDRIWFFDVYSSPWFSAIYLLLMVSLIGCIIPRLRILWGQLRQKVPNAPRLMSILPFHRSADQGPSAEDVRKRLSKQRWRTQVYSDDESTTIAAEKGYLREIGNLAFHISIIGILVGMAMSSFFSWYGYRILSEGPQQAFCNNLQQYDEYGLGPYVNEDQLPDFCLQLDEFEATFNANQPTDYQADLSYSHEGEDDEYNLRVNHPLNLDGTNVFLIGHGYTPVVTYTDRYGNSTTTRAPFLATDDALNSEGAFKFPDANVDPDTQEQDTLSQTGFESILVPTYDPSTERLIGDDPELNNPVLALTAYQGDLGMDDGSPQSVYSLDADMIDAGLLEQDGDEVTVIGMGDELELSDGSSLRFDDLEEYAVLQVRYNPSQFVLLITAVVLMSSLIPMLAVRRRRFWVRLHDDGSVEYAGLTKTEFDGFDEECERLIELVNGRIDPDDDETPHDTKTDSTDPQGESS